MKVVMKAVMKKVFKFIRKVLFLSICAITLLMCIKAEILYFKYIYLGVLIYCILYIFSIIFFKEKWNDIFFIGAIIWSCLFTFMFYKPALKPTFDTSTLTGQLQQEIYDESGVAVYYNTKIKEVRRIKHQEEIEITEEEAITALKEIKKTLSFYSGFKPNKIYILNNANMKGSSILGGASAFKNVILLCNKKDIKETLHHEMGHIIVFKTLKINDLINFTINHNSCSIVSDYACENKDELFAETWETAITENKTTSFSQNISNIFKENLRYFKNPNYINVDDLKENLNKLINKETESFIIKKTDENMLNSLLQQFPSIKEINRLDVGDEILFYNLKED